MSTKAVSSAVENALQKEMISSKILQAFGQARKDDKSRSSDWSRGKDTQAQKGTKTQKFAELTPSLNKLTEDLQADIRAGRLQLNLEPRGLVISLKEGAFFSPGDDRLNKERLGSLGKLAAVIKQLPNPVRLEGHTDATPISNSRFRNNWELSAARSIEVLQLLKDSFGVQESRMAIVGYADTAPLESNDTEDGRAHNRRVDITILSAVVATREPKAAR